MDFASLMSREIAKEIPSASKKNTSSAYVKKAEVEKQREEAYRREQAKLQQAREDKAQRKRQIEEDEVARKLERDEKRRRLAEDSRQWREEEAARKERAKRKRLGLPEAIVQEKVEEEENYEEAKIPESQKDLPIPTTLLLLPEQDLRVPATTPPDKEDLPHLYRQLVSYFTLLLEAWRDALAARPAAVAGSTAGKAALTAYTSSVLHLRPLFGQFERGTLEPHLLKAVLEIVSAAQDRRYVDANDAYLRLSIGKAAWPIGVTMVGIHERSAREKLSEHGQARTDGVAHIMSDEGTRKWLQSLKRCLSFAQTRWPPEDIGQMMG